MRKGSEQQLEQLLGVTPDDRERERQREWGREGIERVVGDEIIVI